MAAVVLAEQELQHSIATSEDDAEFEEDDELAPAILADNAGFYAANTQLHNGMLDQSEEEEEEDEEDISSEEEEIELDDAEDEEDDEIGSIPNNDDTEPEIEEEDDDEDGEGVGAVKIQPGLKQHEEDEEASISEEGSVTSAGEDDNESKDSMDFEVGAVWETVAPGKDEEPANPNRCIFCHQNEENDPGEEFELYLACGVCGDNAHRYCARKAEALKTDDESENWYCPDCVTNKLVPEAVLEVEETPEVAAGRISRDRIAGDLLPPQSGAIKPGSHSVFNQLITPDDPMDGSRLLRKRKTPPAEIDDTSSQRRKTRDKDHSTSQTKMAHVDAPVEPLAEKMELDLHVDAADLPLTNGELKKAYTPSISRASRSLRIKSNAVLQAPVTITERSKTSMKITFRVNPASLKKLLSRPPKPSRKGQKKKLGPPPISQGISYTPSFGQPFYSLHNRETDELKSKPYGGILTTEEADTTITLPKTDYRRQFDEGRQKAEEEWKARVASAAEAAAALGLKKSKKVSGPASQIEYIEFGQHQIDTWYAAPYPEEYSRNKAVFICEFCLKYMESDIVAWRHKTKCPWKHPPGDEIYRDGKIMIFEVDGRKNQFYCQNLCLLAKLFLGSKTLYYDVEPFLFYVMTEYDEYGCHFVGYFSKEKRPSSQNNVSCILVLPIHQRKGYGHLLVDFSYLLTRVEKKSGSPEKPLSDMGLVSYRNYWRLILSYYLREFRPGDPVPSIRKMSNDTGLTPDDVISALDALGSLIREPDSGAYAFKLKTDIYNTVIGHHEVKNYPALNPRALIWTPYIVGRGGLSIYEHALPLNTIAPREDDEVQSVELSHSNTNGKADLNPSVETNGVTDAVFESFAKMSNGSDTFHQVTQVKEDIDRASSSSKVNGVAKPLSYFEAAASIPATQFIIFPPPRGSSRARGTPRPLLSRVTPSSRASAGRPRATPRANHSVKRSSARPKSTSRKKSGGGTGRGPGRWPKGTKKSDFDNAGSGPGLPPKMVKQRSRLNNEVLLGDEAEENGDEHDIAVEMEEDDDGDGIVYETPAPSRRRERNRNLGKAASASGGSRRSAFKAMDEDFAITGDIDEDEEMEDGPVITSDMDLDLKG